MKHNPAFWRAFHSLTHPLSLLANGLLLFNDHWLRHNHPSWLTGKLGDFTWLVFAPFIAGLVIAWLIPRRLENHTQWVVGLSFGFIGIWFATAKTIPLVHQWTTDTLAWLVGWRGTLRLDATDLLTLPALLIGWWIWQRTDDHPLSLTARRHRRSSIAYVALGLGLLGTLATSEPYRSSTAGIEQTCIYGEKSLYTTYLKHGESEHYISDDGGLNWTYRNTIDETQIQCDGSPEIIVHPDNPAIQYRWVANDRIERSNNRGTTWVVDNELDFLDEEARIYYITRNSFASDYILNDLPIHVIVDPATHHIIFSMGIHGSLVRDNSGNYHWIRVVILEL